VDFKNTVIVMTSNAGAHTLKKQRSMGFGGTENAEKSHEDMRENIMGEVRQIFRPEFLNRVDETIVFHALTENEIDEIARLLLGKVCKRLQERGIELEVDDEALRLISKAGYDLKYGARPLRRAIQRLVEDALSEEILLGDVHLGDKVLASVQEDKLKFIPCREVPQLEAASVE
jgi:ATP-dependent Clp protease ATP-binding subunit ClpC